ncbi:MAG TPA: DUF805 domain-containing protein [Actinomycetes bacterium]|nr:DUF805 domain-containing protein [Actinomycetes bacterium]
MVSFPDAIKSAFAQYASFAGRSTRAEYWWFGLFVFVVDMVFYIPLILSLPASGEDPSGAVWLFVGLLSIFNLIIVIPSICLLVRRLHDIDKSGWWYWVQLIPCIGPIWLFILTIMPSTPGRNQYG